jgi:hypothetical protein
MADCPVRYPEVDRRGGISVREFNAEYRSQCVRYVQSAQGRIISERSGHRVRSSSATLLLLALRASAAVWQVGPGEQYMTPCSAIAVAATGDTIQIDASGSYSGDVCGWATDDLTIIGVNGRPKIDVAGAPLAQGRGIWIISGKHTTVENIEFTGASGPNHNGAGIWQIGANLTVRKCYFHDNEEGILAGDNASSEILVENSEFAENGYRDGQSHNIYINHVAKFTLRFSYSHDAVSGHLVKSRAQSNFILYNRLSGESGTSSLELDLPNGGLSYVIGNIIEQGPLSENLTIVAYGEEGATNANNTLFFVNNTVVNNRWNGVFIKLAPDVARAVVTNNIFNGHGSIVEPPIAQLSHNLRAGALFVDPSNYDYHPKSGSPAIDFGVNPGMDKGYSLLPSYQYVHPNCFETRKTVGRAIDAGAFELRGGGGPDASCAPAREGAGVKRPHGGSR